MTEPSREMPVQRSREPISAQRRARAKAERTSPTWTEAQLWKQLRHSPIRIRRQAPIRPYIADFACLRARLIFEVDGAIHELPHVAQRDAKRDAWLAREGYAVLRIDARRIPSETTAVVEEIMAAIAARIPLPLEGEGVRGRGGLAVTSVRTPMARISRSRRPDRTTSTSSITPSQPSPLKGEGK